MAAAAVSAVSGHLNPAALAQTLDRVFDDAQHTGIVDLSCRNLKEYPHVACDYDLSDTVETNLSKNRFNELPREICLYLSSEVLNCYHNCLRSIPEAILNLQQLTYLNLSRNQLTQLPSYICRLQSLEVLLIRSNRLTELPGQLGLLGRLAELDASWNELEHVPRELSTLASLRSLDLAHNALVDVPPELCRLNLRCLDLSSNQIQCVPLEYRAMDMLERLSLDNNPLVCPPAHICTKGRVHILKYLHIVALKEERRKSSLTAAAATSGADMGETGRRSGHAMSGTDECDSRKAPALVNCEAYFKRTAFAGLSSNGAGPPIDTRLSRSGRAGRSSAFRQLQEPMQLVDCNRDMLNGDLTSSRSPVGNTSPRLSPVMLAANACSYNVVAPITLSLAEHTQYYSTATPPAGTPVGSGNSADELLRQKQEYDIKRRRAPAATAAATAELKPGHLKDGCDKDRLLLLPGYGSSSIASAAECFLSRQPCSAPAQLDSLQVKPSPSAMSDASQTDTLFSTDSLNGFSAASGAMSVWASSVTARPPATVSAKTSSARGDPVHAGRAEAVGRSGNARPVSQQTGKSVGRPHVSAEPSEALGTAKRANVQQQTNGPQRPSFASGATGLPCSGSDAESSNVADNDEAQVLKGILESRLKIKLSDDLPNALRDGVVLCMLVNHVRPRSVLQIHMPTAAVPKLTMTQCRRNVDNFIQACRRLGVPEAVLCSRGDVLDAAHPQNVVRTLRRLLDMRRVTCADIAVSYFCAYLLVAVCILLYRLPPPQ